MTLLMPEFERHLREAVRRRAGAGGAPRRSRAWVLALRGALVAVAVVIAVVAVVVTGHGGRRGGSAPGHGVHRGVLVGQGCPQLAPPRLASSGRRAIATVARGTIDGHRWALRAVRALGFIAHRLDAFVLDGRAYSVCGNAAALVDVRPRGILYVFLVGGGPFAVRLPGADPVVTRRVAGGTFFAFALRGSACAYHSLALSLTGADRTFRALLHFGSPCRQDQVVPPGPPPPIASAVLPNPTQLSGAKRAEFLAGAAAVAQSGCLACHAIGKLPPGSAVGPNLGDVGNLLRPASIRSTLLHPTPPMPSFASLPRRKLRALVYFLSQLRSGG